MLIDKIESKDLMSFNKIKTRWYLFPFSFLYGIGVSIRNRLFDAKIFRSYEFSIPLITVGNISVGGTGKTPHVEYIVKILNNEFEVCTLSRGYKRKTKNFLIADENSTIYDIGDEPKQIKQKFPNVCVVVDADRKNAINKIINDEEKSTNVVVLDDAYQHRKVKPGLSVLLIDYNRPITKDYLLPVGSLRERSWRKNRANLIVVTKAPKDLSPIDRRIMEKELEIFPYQSLFFTTFKYGNLVPVFKNNDFSEPEITNKTNILVITGIAMPKPLLGYLGDLTKNIEHLRFADHHNYNEKDINSIIERYNNIASNEKIIITTEKDAMRIQDCKFAEKLKDLPLYFIPVEVEFLDKSNEEYFNKIVLNYVRTNKRHSKLHK